MYFIAPCVPHVSCARCVVCRACVVCATCTMRRVTCVMCATCVACRVASVSCRVVTGRVVLRSVVSCRVVSCRVPLRHEAPCRLCAFVRFIEPLHRGTEVERGPGRAKKTAALYLAALLWRCPPLPRSNIGDGDGSAFGRAKKTAVSFRPHRGGGLTTTMLPLGDMGVYVSTILMRRLFFSPDPEWYSFL